MCHVVSVHMALISEVAALMSPCVFLVIMCMAGLRPIHVGAGRGRQLLEGRQNKGCYVLLLSVQRSPYVVTNQDCSSRPPLRKDSHNVVFTARVPASLCQHRHPSHMIFVKAVVAGRGMVQC